MQPARPSASDGPANRSCSASTTRRTSRSRTWSSASPCDHQNGQHITGTNTRRHGRAIADLDGTGYVDYSIPTLSLLEGTYELTAAIQDWTEAHDYDHWRHGLRFDVLPSTVHEEGYVSLQGGWQISDVDVGVVGEGASCRRSLS